MPLSAPLACCGRQRRRRKCPGFGSLAPGIALYCCSRTLPERRPTASQLQQLHAVSCCIIFAEVQVRQLLRLQRFLLSSYNSRASAELAVRMPDCLSTEGSCRQLKARGGTGRTAPEISLPLGLRTVRGSSMLNMPGFPEAEHGWNLKQKVFSDAAQYSIGNEDVVQGAEVSCHGQASAILLQVWFF